MNTTTLNDTDRATVESLCALMMQMNARNDENARYSSTYGCLSDAIVAFVGNATGIDISNPPTRYGWNLGGNRCYADDIQAVIDLVVYEETHI
jgi:hypothetical protein